MSYPNQLAIGHVVQGWIDESQALPGDEAVRRLGLKIDLVQNKIHKLSLASYRDAPPPEDVAGLSVVELMSAQGSLIVERAVRARGVLAVAA